MDEINFHITENVKIVRKNYVIYFIYAKELNLSRIHYISAFYLIYENVL